MRHDILYQWRKTGDKQYQQYALHNCSIHIHNPVVDYHYSLKKGQVGGIFKLSDDKAIQKAQLNDIEQSNLGNLKQNAWIGKNSVVKGNFKLPLTGLVVNSKLISDSRKPGLIDNSIINKTQCNSAKSNQLLITNSLVDNCKLDSKLSKDPQLSFIEQSHLQNSQFDTNHDTLYVSKSHLKGVKATDSLSMVNSNLQADQGCFIQTAMLNDVKGHIKKPKYIKNQSLEKQTLSDQPAKQQNVDNELEI